MNEKYNSFIEKVKAKSKIKKGINITFINNESSHIENSDNSSILDIKEYVKDFLTIGVALIKKEIIKPIDYSNLDNIEIETTIKYYAKMMIADKEYEIDNIMVKSFDSLDDAREYYTDLINLVNNNSLDDLILIFNDKIS